MAFYRDLKKERYYPHGTVKPGQAGWIANRILRLRALLNGNITSKRRPNSLIVGSWNIQHFDGGMPRLPESFHYIAEVIDHFDICALQEVKSIESIERLMDLLGPNWDYFINDSGGRGRGNHERMAFLYNKNKVFFRNLIGELVVPQNALPGGEQVGRTPYFAAFQAGWFKFTLCSAHIVFTEVAGRPLREDEIRVVGEELAKRAKKTEEVHVFIGDMNIETRNDAGMKALEKAGFEVPDMGPTSASGTKHYDQIAFTGLEGKTEFLNMGVIPVYEAVFLDEEAETYRPIANAIRRNMRSSEWFWSFHQKALENADAGISAADPYEEHYYKDWRNDQMSDHLPIWIELEVDYSNEYLRAISKL